MKKSHLSFLVLSLLAVALIVGESISISSVSAKTATETPGEPAGESTGELTSIITPEEAATAEAGEAWSGDIVEPGGTTIGEPPIPDETPTPSSPVKTTDVVTTPTTYPTVVPTAVAPAPAPQPEPISTDQASSTTDSNNSDSTNSTFSPDSTNTDSTSDDSSLESDTTYVEVPKTSFAERNRKITLMALISTALVFFFSIFVASAFSLFRLIRSERQQKEHESAVEETIRRHITRAE